MHLPPVVEALQKVTKATISNEESVRHACVMLPNRIFRLGGKRSCLVTCSVLALTRIIHYISLSAFLKPSKCNRNDEIQNFNRYKEMKMFSLLYTTRLNDFSSTDPV